MAKMSSDVIDANVKYHNPSNNKINKFITKKDFKDFMKTLDFDKDGI